MATTTFEITYKEKEYDLVFNFNVIEEIQEKYGSIDAWSDLVSGDNINASALKFGITAMINEGIDIYNEENEDKRDLFTDKQVGRLITDVGLQTIAEKMQGEIANSSEDGEKNE